MKTSEAIDQLATALAAAQAEMPDAVLDRNNPHFKSKYASLASVRKATQALHKQGIAVVHAKEFLPDGSYSLCTRIIHGKSGQWIESEWPISIGTPQAMGSSETYGRRYNLSGLTSVAADDDDDANAAEAHSSITDDEVKGGKVQSKAKSRETYNALVTEMRALTDREVLRRWWIDSGERRRSMDPGFQRYLIDDARKHETAIEVGADEEGRTIGEKIGDEIPEPGASG